MLKLYSLPHPTHKKQSLLPNQPLPSITTSDDDYFQTIINLPNNKHQIKKVNVNGSDLHILTENGLCYICSNGCDGSDLYLLNDDDDDNLFIDDFSSFSESATLYLVRYRKLKEQNTFLYGGGRSSYHAFGNDVDCTVEIDNIRREKLRILYSPPVDEYGHRSQITHIGSCYAFTVMVLDYCDIRIGGQDWVNSGKEMNWHVSQFKSEKKIKKIECGSFQFIVIFEDDTIMCCGDNLNGQMPNERKDFLHFSVNYEMRVDQVFVGYDFSVVKYANTSPNPENYKLFGASNKDNLKELVKSFPIFNHSNENSGKIKYEKDYFAIEFNGIFYVINQKLSDGFMVDISKVFETPGGEYHVAINTNAIVFYKTSSIIIYPKLFTYQKEAKLTDCYFQYQEHKKFQI